MCVNEQMLATAPTFHGNVYFTVADCTNGYTIMKSDHNKLHALYKLVFLTGNIIVTMGKETQQKHKT